MFGGMWISGHNDRRLTVLLFVFLFPLVDFCSNRLFSDYVGPGRGRARGEYCQIWDIEVCAAVKGVVFK